MPILKNPYGSAYAVSGSVGIKNEISVPPKPTEQTHEQEEQAFQPAESEQVFPRGQYEKMLAECDELKAKATAEAAQIMGRAKEAASELVAKTKEASDKHVEAARTEAEAMLNEAREKGRKVGYTEGYSDGDKRGYDEGYVKGLKKCKDTLVELKQLMEELSSEREEIFRTNERRMFDLIFDIAQKITVDSLKQRDKGVITKMLKEAGKGFRNSEHVKITLSELDVSDIAAFSEEMSGYFTDSQHIEFEVLRDAPQGTLILDDGAEITDAGVNTQLKMIEELGRGKYRGKTSERAEADNDNAGTEDE